MDKIAAGPASDRRDLFQESASQLGMNPAIVEKDFWVCWILKLLFVEPALKNQMVFKGGTRLSKVFGLIDRFSEDIDLVLDWRLLGYDQEGATVPCATCSTGSLQHFKRFWPDWRHWNRKSTLRNEPANRSIRDCEGLP
jgi:hypothetical protein